MRACTSRANTVAAAGATADHRRERALHGGDLQPLVERLGEHHERTAVVAGDHDEDDRAAEVGHGAADLGAVLQLPAAHRLRRPVEAGQVRQHDERAVAAGGVDRRVRACATTAETACRRTTRTGRPPARIRAGATCAIRFRSGIPGCRRCAHPTRSRSRRRAIGPSAPAARESCVGHGPHHRAHVERLLALGVVSGGEDLADRCHVASPRSGRAAQSARLGLPGRSVAPPTRPRSRRGRRRCARSGAAGCRRRRRG